MRHPALLVLQNNVGLVATSMPVGAGSLKAVTEVAEKVSRDAGSLPADVRGGKPSGVSHEEQTAMRGRNPNTRSTPTNLEANSYEAESK